MTNHLGGKKKKIKSGPFDIHSYKLQIEQKSILRMSPTDLCKHEKKADESLSNSSIRKNVLIMTKISDT